MDPREVTENNYKGPFKNPTMPGRGVDQWLSAARCSVNLPKSQDIDLRRPNIRFPCFLAVNCIRWRSSLETQEPYAPGS